MNSIVWIVYITSIIYVRVIQSKFVDISSNYNDDESRKLDLKDNEAMSDLFETSQFHHRCKTQQKYKGISIFGATLVVELDPNDPDDVTKKVAISGKWYDEKDIDQLVASIIPEIDEYEAIQIALNGLDINSNDVYSKTHCNLYIYYHNSFPYLCYILKFSYIKQRKENEIHQPVIIINAMNGNIFKIYDEIYNVIEACGDGGNGITGKYEYCVDEASLLINSNINPVLENDVVEIYENHNRYWSDHSAATKVTCSGLYSPPNSTYPRCYIDDIYTNGAYCPACDLYAFANVVFEMFGQWTNATYPISPAYVPMRLFIHVGSNWANANFDPFSGEMNFGDGDSLKHPFTVLDVTAHEIAHGYTDQGSNLIYAAESGGMNEAFSDIAGETAEYWFFGTNDWETGGELYKDGRPLRYMHNPPLDGVSIDHYSDYRGQNVHYTSGLYNKAAYNLNINGNWTMEQIFRVFAWANLFYWTPDSTFSEGINGLHQALYDIYDDNITDVDDMADALDLAFFDVGLAAVNVTIPGDGNVVSCGLNRYCYYMNISASDNRTTNHTLNIKADDDSSTTYFDIYFTVNNGDCIRPKLSFKYELIDYDSPTEYIDVFDNDNVLINRCQGGYSCGIFDTSCINNYNLGVAAIKIDETYKITVTESSEVDDLCGTGPTINAFVTIQCDYGTIAPTIEPTEIPTIEPTTPSFEPTVNPTIEPTEITLNPTPYPTNVKINCGVNTFCYIVDIYPSLTEQIENTVIIQNPDDNSNTYFNVFFIIHGNDCVSPRISFEHELIDYDAINEYIDLFDDNDNEIIRCQGGFTCNQYSQCITDYDIGVNKIKAAKEHYKITIFESFAVDSQCFQYHTDSINARLKLTCGAGTANPTIEPTENPTLAPTIPTINPTPAPTINKVSCGLNRWCFQVPVVPNTQFDTEWSVPIQNQYVSGTRYFDIYFNIISNTASCINPRLTFKYERIDYDSSTEYIDVFDNNNGLIQRCGAGVSNLCNNYATCFDERSLGLTQINAGGTYQMSLTESSAVNSLCSAFHLLSINANVTLHCQGGTAAPTAPTVEPTRSPIIMGEKIPCGPNRYCYTVPIYPSYKEDTEFSVNITNYNDNVETYFDVFFLSKGDDCMYPSISFEFEEIDFLSPSEYIDILENDILIQRCTGNQDANCGNFIQCVNNYDLQIDTISMDDTYKVSLTESAEIDAFCGSNSINAKLTIKCSKEDIFDISSTMDMSSTFDIDLSSTMTSEYCSSIQGTISCDESVTDRINKGEHHCYEFIPNTISTVTFSDCKSQFDTKLFVYNDNDEWISQIYCDGDDCGLNQCSTGYREIFTIPDMRPNQTYYVIIEPYSDGGDYQIDIQCDDGAICGIKKSVVNNYSLSNLINNGWINCYSFPYSGGSIQHNCPIGNDYYLFVGAIQNAIPNQIYVGAYGSSSILSIPTGSTTTAYKPTIFANDDDYKVYWYLIPPGFGTVYAAGFAPTSDIALNSALGDIFNLTDEKRLSWNIYGTGGWRAGSNIGLVTTAWQKVMYYKNCTTPSPPTTAIPTTAIPTLHPVIHPTASPVERGQKYFCGSGENRWCYTMDIYPSYKEETEFSVNITNIDDNTNTYFDITFISHYEDCINPSIDFVFEEIDFSSSFVEYLNVLENDNLIKQCTGARDANCGHFIQCLNNYDLSVDMIESGNTLKISIFEPVGVDALCTPTNQWSINAKLTLHCDVDDSFQFSSTMDMLSTFDMSSTIDTNYCDTIESVISCNEMKTGRVGKDEHRCFELDINTTSTVTFSNCGSDFDTKLYVFDTNDEWISKPYCDGDDCNQHLCANRYQETFSIPDLNANGTYYVVIEPYSDGGNYKLDIQCTAPTPNPTLAPTSDISLCATVPYPTWCYNVHIYPGNGIITKTVNITDIYRSSDVYFNISFISRGKSCNNPSITFEYEQIDIASSTEYIDVKNNESTLLQRCQGNGGSDVQCNVWWTCLNDYNLGISKININTRYQIQLVASIQNNAFCTQYHQWSTNALLTLTCDGTAAPTIHPTTYPTTSPTVLTMHPTVSPTSTGYWTPWYGSWPGTEYVLETVYGYHITQICVKSGFLIDSIEVDFNNGAHSGPFGGIAGGGPHCYDIANYVNHSDTQCFTAVNIGIGDAIDYLQFFTSFGSSTSKWGGNGGIPYNITGNNNECITKMAVRTDGKWLRQIRIYFDQIGGTHPSPTTAPTNIPTIEPTRISTTTLPVITKEPTKIPTFQPTRNPTNECQCTSDICYSVDAIGSNYQQVTTNAVITNINDNTATSFGICYNIINNDCKNPRFSFQYERIDYDSSGEYISVYDDNNILLTNCGGSISNLCGIFDECLSDYNIGIDRIYKNSSYQITVTQSNLVGALCEDNNIHSTYSMNGRVKLHCGTQTNEPTTDPTKGPTVIPTTDPSIQPTSKPTFNPTMKPTFNPTIKPTKIPTFNPTINPTKSPTFNPTIKPTKSPTFDPTIGPTSNPTMIPTINPTDPSCKADKCYYQTITQQTSHLTISNTDNHEASLIYVYYRFEEYHCDNPRLTFEYEKVDIDRASEYITIRVNNTFIADCGTGINQCGDKEQCFNNMRLDKEGIVDNEIYIGQTLKISIFVSDTTNALCETADHELYTINAELTIKCNQIDVAEAAIVGDDESASNHIFSVGNTVFSLILSIFILLFFCILCGVAICFWKKWKNKNDRNNNNDNIDISQHISNALEMVDAKSIDVGDNDNDENAMSDDGYSKKDEELINNNDDEKEIIDGNDTNVDEISHEIHRATSYVSHDEQEMDVMLTNVLRQETIDIETDIDKNKNHANDGMVVV